MNERKKLLRTFLKNKAAIIGALISLVVITVAIFAPWIAPYDPLEQNVYHRFTAPEGAHLLGTDFYGRDLLSRVIWGARVSLAVGTTSVLLGMVIGTLSGLAAAYNGGKTRIVIMRVVDIMMSFPDEVFGIMMLMALGSGLIKLIIVIALLFAPRFTRLAYAPALALKEKDFVIAAEAVGASKLRIITHHFLPNIFGEILVMGTLWVGTAIRLEANLSFLGLGVPPPTPTWGNTVRKGVEYLTTAPWVSTFAGLAILITILGFNTMGDGLRDVADPKLRI
jgi:peptide/nickel transport system permease protein